MAEPKPVIPQGFLHHMYALQHHKGVVRDCNLEVRKLMPKRFKRHGSEPLLVAGGLHAVHRTKSSIESPATYQMRRGGEEREIFDPLTVCAPGVHAQLEAEARRKYSEYTYDAKRKETVRQARMNRGLHRDQRIAQVADRNLKARMQVELEVKNRALLMAANMPLTTARSTTPGLSRSASQREIGFEALPFAGVARNTLRPNGLRPFREPPSLSAGPKVHRRPFPSTTPSTRASTPASSTRNNTRHRAPFSAQSMMKQNFNQADDSKRSANDRPSTSIPFRRQNSQNDPVVASVHPLESYAYLFAPMQTPNHIADQLSPEFESRF
jgi:hypothetical protein